MEVALKYILYAVSLVATVTGLNVLVGGAAAVPGASGAVEATVDNELRFFSVFWIAYGGFCFWISRNFQEQRKFVPAIALVFFMGGVGRLVSTILVGRPSSILVPAMVLEFILPIAIFVLYRGLYKEHSAA